MSPKIVVLISVLAISQAYDWRNGAYNNNTATPYTAACITGNFRPSIDDYMPQNTPSPFKITVTTNSKDGRYHHGTPVTVQIRAINPNMHAFESYHIRGDCSKPVFNGSFTCDGGKPSEYCNEPKNTNRKVEAITNMNGLMKQVVTCKWMPPSHSIGNVQFAATVVQTDQKFWTGVLSKVIKPSTTVISYEAHQNQLVKMKMAEFQRMQAKAMMSLQQMMGGAAGQMAGKAAGNPFASMLGGAAAKSNQQAANPMMQMMSGLMQGQRQNRGMNQQQKWGNRFNMGGEAQGGEAGENPMFGGW